MIHYSSDGIHFFTKLFRVKGSVFPVGLTAATPCAMLAGSCKYFANEGHLGEWWQQLIDHPDSILKDNAMWSGFTFLVGFLVVFRTSQAYARFWEGCATTYRMRAVWFSACSALCAFTRSSKREQKEVVEFKELLVRMFSMLHALALAEIEDCNIHSSQDVPAFNYPVIDPMALDYDVLASIRDSPTKPELVFQWIQQYIVEQINSGVLNIAPPILSRSFQDLAGGMMIMYEAIKISCNPFPFPYAQTCDCLLIIHWIVTPLVAAARGSNPIMVCMFSFITVFIMWTLNLIAVELENPFGSDANDLDCEEAQKDLNQSLAMLLQPVANHLPKIPSKDKSHPDDRASLAEAWLILEEAETWEGATNADGEMVATRSSKAKAEAAKEASASVARSARNRKGRQALTVTKDRTNDKSHQDQASRHHSLKHAITAERMSLMTVREEDANCAKVIGETYEKRSAQQNSTKEKDKQPIIVVRMEGAAENSNQSPMAAEPTREIIVRKDAPLDQLSSSDVIDAPIEDVHSSHSPRAQADSSSERLSKALKAVKESYCEDSSSERLSKALKAVKESDCEAPQESPPTDSPQEFKPEASSGSALRLSHKSDSMSTPRDGRQAPRTDGHEAPTVSPRHVKNSARSIRGNEGMYDAPPDSARAPTMPLRGPSHPPHSPHAE